MGKEQVFWELQKHEGEYISGEALSEKLGISRAAVWKSIRALRRDGYTIASLTGSGYRLEQSPDALTEREIRRHLGATEIVGRSIECFESIGSTNTYLKNLDDAPDGLVAVA
ncbi:MAG: biotin operon repressor [Oscillospiraceae bacterium]|nr:biotin operon repressor [Oscillospiraceae bacterium]